MHISIIQQAQKLESLYPEDIIIVFDPDGFYHYVSENREELMGYTREETYNRHFSDFVAPDYVAHSRLNLTNTELTGESIDSAVVLETKSGRRVRFRTVAWTMTDPDSDKLFMIVRARLAPEE